MIYENMEIPKQIENIIPRKLKVGAKINERPQVTTRIPASISDFLIPSLSNKKPPDKLPKMEKNPNKEATRADPKVKVPAFSNVWR